MFHCKVLVVDGLWVSVGSTNFDTRSFRLNDEANLNVYDRDFAGRQVDHGSGVMAHRARVKARSEQTPVPEVLTTARHHQGGRPEQGLDDRPREDPETVGRCGENRFNPFRPACHDQRPPRRPQRKRIAVAPAHVRHVDAQHPEQSTGIARCHLAQSIQKAAHVFVFFGLAACIQAARVWAAEHRQNADVGPVEML